MSTETIEPKSSVNEAQDKAGLAASGLEWFTATPCPNAEVSRPAPPDIYACLDCGEETPECGMVCEECKEAALYD